MARLFNRVASVTLARPLTGQFFRFNPNAIVITDLRFAFQIEKQITSEPNRCELVIVNLSEQTRAELQRKPLHVQIEAGYDNDPFRIFSGDLRWADSTRNGPDWETKIQLGDGDRAYRHARVNRSFKAGVTVKSALEEISKSMGLELPKNVNDAKELLNQFASGISLNGSSSREMTRLLKPLNKEWSVQDNRLQILGKNESRPDQAVIISQDNGMIGSPEYGPPKEKGKQPILTVRTLLYPQLIPGGLIDVQSVKINGLFRVERVVHIGDTRGDEWYSEVEAKPV